MDREGRKAPGKKHRKRQPVGQKNAKGKQEIQKVHEQDHQDSINIFYRVQNLPVHRKAVIKIHLLF